LFATKQITESNTGRKIRVSRSAISQPKDGDFVVR
jgi:hypothetical protein